MTKAASPVSDLTTGYLAEVGQDTIVLALANTDYRLHLAVTDLVNGEIDKPISGRITARARRVDPMQSGGRFVEPVYGRPRRIQGTIIATDPQANTISVQCAGRCTFICELVTNQHANEFEVGTLVGFDIERGAKLELN